MSSEQDRELLELAAKVAGIVGEWDVFMGTFRHYLDDERRFLGTSWNPLTDDGDALRLAVKLGLQITVCRNDKTFVERDNAFVGQDHDDDSMAATRRAIVRAAAQLAKGAEK
jgi:hypothetical protein